MQVTQAWSNKNKPMSSTNVNSSSTIATNNNTNNSRGQKVGTSALRS